MDINSSYRPFKDSNECFEEMSKHTPFGWVVIWEIHIKCYIIKQERFLILPCIQRKNKRTSNIKNIIINEISYDTRTARTFT